MELPVAPQSESRAEGGLGDCLAIWTRVAQRGGSTNLVAAARLRSGGVRYWAALMTEMS